MIPIQNRLNASGGPIQLWQFLVEMLLDRSARNCIIWTGKDWEFRMGKSSFNENLNSNSERSGESRIRQWFQESNGFSLGLPFNSRTWDIVDSWYLDDWIWSETDRRSNRQLTTFKGRAWLDSRFKGTLILTLWFSGSGRGSQTMGKKKK